MIPPADVVDSAVHFTYCLNAKSSEERVVYKRLNSTGTLIQRTNTEAPQVTLCITSGWMFTRRRSATASKMPAVRFTRKAKLGQRAGNWIAGSRLFHNHGRWPW